jgi:hypothetical protein
MLARALSLIHLPNIEVKEFKLNKIKGDDLYNLYLFFNITPWDFYGEQIPEDVDLKISGGWTLKDWDDYVLCSQGIKPVHRNRAKYYKFEDVIYILTASRGELSLEELSMPLNERKLKYKF